MVILEGVNTIADKAEFLGMPFDKLMIKQPALEKYVEEMSPSFIKRVEYERDLDQREVHSWV